MHFGLNMECDYLQGKTDTTQYYRRLADALSRSVGRRWHSGE
jgi:hypothetical protein